MSSNTKRTNSVKDAMLKLMDDNKIIRAKFLYERRFLSNEDVFCIEHIAHFLLRVIINYYGDRTPQLVIPEEIIDFFLGSNKNDFNYIEVTLRANSGIQIQNMTEEEWEEFYYLRLLPAKKLFHLTNKFQKTRAADICKSVRYQHSKIEQTYKPVEFAMESYPSIIRDFKGEALDCLMAFSSSAISHRRRAVAITIFGFHRSMMGLGEDARRLFEICSNLGFRVELYDCAPAGLPEDECADFYQMFETKCPTAELAIFCMPLFEMARIIPDLSTEFFRGRHTIGYWPWELTKFPDGWRAIMNMVDEVWASTHFLQGVFSRECDRPVYYMPLCVEIKSSNSPVQCRPMELNGEFGILSVFDFNSAISRKNPIGAIRAFKLAFEDSNSSVSLTIKTINGSRNSDALNLIKSEICADDRITLIDAPYSRAEINNLIGRSSAFLSLHRSEGFGRLLAEAMLLEVPVIATDWSGSQDFTLEQHSFPVKYEVVSVEPHDYPYAAGHWAEPDIHHASEILKFLQANRQIGVNKAQMAKDYILNKHSLGAVADQIESRLNEILLEIGNKIDYFGY